MMGQVYTEMNFQAIVLNIFTAILTFLIVSMADKMGKKPFGGMELPVGVIQY